MSKEITALIADDEAHMRTFMKLLLLDLGVKNIYLMQNGMDAIDAFREYQPDLVMLDINMNVMNGLEALEGIKKINPETKVIMMTAVSTRESVEECSRKGATYYILKTQTPEDIRTQLKSVIESIGVTV
ncbi:MAG: two-component system chemotaxis response regulator CheY [Candidatus Pelagisphaera sp.]|jgi:two-component system chemotaxis response regulator CheY